MRGGVIININILRLYIEYCGYKGEGATFEGLKVFNKQVDAITKL